ncbi:MAG: class I SAM-dependent methyltransferase [Armatimonadota bacterium]
MNPAEYEKMYRLERDYWWFVGRRYLVRLLILQYAPIDANHPLMILDIGCGTGATAQELAQFGTVVALDVSETALRYTSQRGVGNLVVGSGEALPLPSGFFDLVTALDVLEHMDDDARGASEIRRILKPNGILVATVPALPLLWSQHDEALHHRRRYTASSLLRLMENHGFSVKKLSYCMTFLFPIVLAARLLERLHPPQKPPSTTLPAVGPAVNSALSAILRCEANALLKTNFPIGVSLVCVAKVPC